MKNASNNICRENYLRVMKYLQRLSKRGLNPASIEIVRAHLYHFLRWAGKINFWNCHTIEKDFYTYLSTTLGRKGELLSYAYQADVLESVHAFLLFEKDDLPEKYKRMRISFIKEMIIPYNKRPPHKSISMHKYISEKDIIELISAPISDNDLLLKRARASAAFLFLSGQRAGAFVTTPIFAVNTDKLLIQQDPELGVATKNKKKCTTALLTIEPLVKIVREWDRLMRSKFSVNMPWFPTLESHWGEFALSNRQPGRGRQHSLNDGLRRISETVGITYRSAHAYRHGHAVYA